MLKERGDELKIAILLSNSVHTVVFWQQDESLKPEQQSGLRLAAGCCSVLKVTLSVFEQDNEFIH